MCVCIRIYTEKINFKVDVLFILLMEKYYDDISNEYLVDIIFLQLLQSYKPYIFL